MDADKMRELLRIKYGICSDEELLDTSPSFIAPTARMALFRCLNALHLTAASAHLWSTQSIWRV